MEIFSASAVFVIESANEVGLVILHSYCLLTPTECGMVRGVWPPEMIEDDWLIPI